MSNPRTGVVSAIGRATGFLAVADGTSSYSVVETFTSLPIEPGWELAGDLQTPGSKHLWVQRRDESISAIVQFAGLDLATALRVIEHQP